MSDIALYNLLKRIPDATADEVEKAVADVASSKEVATKADLETGLADLKTEMAERETRLVRQMYAVAGIIIAAITLIVKVF